MSIQIRAYQSGDLPEMTAIWNEVVEEGIAFPQTELLTDETAGPFFAAQSHTAVAEREGRILGLYILHPNNVGRCGHLSNASFAVSAAARGRQIGEALVRDCLDAGARLGFRVLQFNAVVRTNERAIRLYRKLGFTALGTVPGGFLMKDGRYEDIVLFYHLLGEQR